MKLNQNQQAFIELTNPIHGGEGWELGKALWAPTKTRNTGKRKPYDKWRTIKDVKPGDIIIHSVKTSGKNHRFWGISIAKTAYMVVDEEPPIPEDWSKAEGYEAYYKVLLKDCKKLSKTPFVSDFLGKYSDKLSKFSNSFYDRFIRHPKQDYLFKLDTEIFNMIIEYLENC